MSTYLITGATGFLGHHLVPALLDAGHTLVALTRRPAPAFEAQGVQVVIGDVCDAESVKKAAKGCDGLFHCAGIVSRDPEDTKKMYDVHVNGTKITLDAAKEAGIKRVVYMSTSGTVAIREKKKPIPNEDSHAPYTIAGKWPYYRTKLYAEQEALKRNTEDFEVISLNPSLLLGPGDLRGGSTEDIRLFIEKQIPAIPKGGLSYVDVRDVAKVCLTAMEKGKAGQRYLLGACNITFEEYLNRLSRLSGVSAPWMQAPKNDFIADMGTSLLRKVQSTFGTKNALDDASLEMARYFWYLDASRAKKDLDFSPIDSVQTLKDTIDDMFARGAVWPVDEEKPDPVDNIKQTAQDTQHRLTELFAKHASKIAADIAADTVSKAIQKRK